jgi:hypothetical protein
MSTCLPWSGSRRSALWNDHRGVPVEVLPSVAVHTRWNSCATPIAATPEVPLAAWRYRCGLIVATLSSFLPSLTALLH